MATGELPTIFKVLSVLYICKFKLNTYYVTKFRKAEPWVCWVVFILEVLAVAIPVSLHAVNCTAMSQKAFMWYSIGSSGLYTVALMVLSAITFHKLMGKLTFGLQKEKRKWLCFLEVFVQIMLVGRLIILTF